MLVKISLQNSWILLCQTPLGGYAIHVNCTEISVVSPVHMLSCHVGLVSRSTGSYAFRFNIMLVKISLQNSWILLCQTPLGGYAIHVNCTEISVVSPVHMLSCHVGLVSRSTDSYAQSQLHYYMECKHRYKG